MSCNNLPMDITQAILSLLPAKSLGRFKSVSKRWESLISDPQFIKTHLLQSNDCHKTRKLTMLSDTKSLYSVDISELGSLYSDDLSATGKEVGFGSSPIKWKEMWGSCNGLVLAEDENGMIYLMNPTTQELWKVPPSPFALPDEESFVMYGFGYDMSTDDYKVISMSIWDPFRDHDTDTDMFVSVYSLRSNSWRKLPNFPYGDDTPYLMRGVLIHQNLHCFTMNSGGCSKIAVFSLADEEFNVIKLPDSTEGVFFDTLVDLGGKLGASGDIWGAGSELWVMEEYGIVESWTRVCIYGYETRNVLPVCLVKGSNRDIVSHNLGEVVVYNIDERRCTNVRIIGVPSSRFKIGGTYVETLESPKRIITPP